MLDVDSYEKALFVKLTCRPYWWRSATACALRAMGCGSVSEQTHYTHSGE